MKVFRTSDIQQGAPAPTRWTVERQGERPTAPYPVGERLLQIHAQLDELTSSPYSHDLLELEVATLISVRMSERDDTPLVWLMAVGAPSSDRTATVQLLKDAPAVLYVDNLTGNAFASGYVPEKGRRRERDLLERIGTDGVKCLIIKDLTTLFSLREDRVRQVLGDLQSIYDGEYTKATGTLGLRTYATKFALIACITPLALSTHQRYLSVIGSRFLLYRHAPLTDQERAEGFGLIWDGRGRRGKVKELRRLVAEHVTALMAFGDEVDEETPLQRARIERLAELLAYGRAAVSWELVQVQREEPFRGVHQLRTLGRALARVHGRSRLTPHELELLRRVVLSSIPVDRVQVLELFPRYPGGLTASVCGAAIGKSEDRARQVLDELARLELVVAEIGSSGGGRPPAIYRPAEKFAELLSTPVATIDHLMDLAPDFPDETPHTLPEVIGSGTGDSYRESPGEERT